jgi:signal transduction histidine kinase
MAQVHEPSSLPTSLHEALRDASHTVSVQLTVGGDVIAVLILGRRRDEPFSKDDVDTLTLLAGPAALAVRNSSLYSRTAEATQVKTTFLDMTAHGLRMPLTVISGYLSIVREGAFGPPPARWQEPLRILDSVAAELRRFVDDLLLAARLETGRLDADPQPLDLRRIVEEACEWPDIRPEVSLPSEPVVVFGVSEQLGRLIDHLISNAVLYVVDGAASPASIALDVLREQREIRLAVEDRGRGLPPEARERVFERFYRYEDPNCSAVPGMGLGLYIGRELAKRHGGRLELEWSQPGIGSRFALYLPLASIVQ